MNDEKVEAFVAHFLDNDLEAARQWLETEDAFANHVGYCAHPLLRGCVKRNDGMCHTRTHLLIADLLTPHPVRRFRDAVVGDRIDDVTNYLGVDPSLIHAEFAAGRGIAQAVHHFESVGVGERLLRAGADLHACTTVHFADETPLALQLRFGRVDCARFLLESGADPNRGVSTSMPSNVMAEFIKLLLDFGWQMNAGPVRRRTMLHHDANHGHGARIAIWLEHGADPNVHDDQGRTPLHVVAARGTGVKTIQSLVDAGADMNATDDDGRTPLDVAKQASRQTAAKLLKKLGARESD